MKTLTGSWSAWRPLGETRAWQTTGLTQDQAQATQERWWQASSSDPHVAHFDHELRVSGSGHLTTPRAPTQSPHAIPAPPHLVRRTGLGCGWA